jgi:arylsulfatase A-like enzyme
MQLSIAYIKGLVLSFSLILFSSGVIAQDEYFKCKGCNLLLLDFDLLRADFIKSKKKLSVTPNIDKFFKNSIKFSDVSSSSGVTAISNTATLTSRHGAFTYALLRSTYEDMPPQIPLRHMSLFQKTPTLIEILKSNGYHTFNANHGWYAGRQMLLDRGVDRYYGLGEVYNSENSPGKIFLETANLLPDTSSPENPFIFLMRSEDLRGLPYRFPINRRKLVDPKVIYKKLPNSDFYEIRFQLNRDGEIRNEYSSFEKSDWMTSSQIKQYNKLSKLLYRQQLKYVDEMVGKVFDELNRKKLLDTTIVILYSNHGDGLYDNKVPNHGVSYQSCVSVPLLIRHPKIVKDITVTTPVALIDLFPTMLDFLDVKFHNKIDGISLIETIKNGSYPNEYLFGVDKESKYVRNKNYKLIVWPDRTKELFDLFNDPGENINLVNKFPNIAMTLQEMLIDHEAEQLELAYDLLKAKIN